MSHPPTLLRAFRHPLILASIALLVINDHVLKYSLHSPLTGKISDFAGLFFFPFLLGILIQLIPGRRRPSAKSALLVGMALSAAAFTAIKTLPAANLVAVTLLRLPLQHLLGLPVQIVRDPSDLLALSVLPAGWALWQRIAARPLTPHNGRLAYLALAAGSLAALASTPCMPSAGVIRLAGEGKLLYAGLTQWGGDFNSILVSEDGGKSWTGVMDRGSNNTLVPKVEAGDLAKNPFEQPVAYPKTVCSSADSRTCYQISGSDDLILESRDGGDTWQVAWQIPGGRASFIQRAANTTVCSKTPDMRAFDLAFITNENSSPALIVAMGNEGLLVHTSGSTDWQRMPFDAQWKTYAPVPTPFQASSLIDAVRYTQAEEAAAASAGLLTWLVLSLWLWYRSGQARPRVTLPLWLMTIASLLLLVPLMSYRPEAYRTIYYLVGMPFFLFMVVMALWYMGSASDQPRVGRLAWPLFLFGLGVFGAVWLCFLLWAVGALVTYELARFLAIGSGLALLLGSVFWLRWQIRRAQNIPDEATPPTPTEPTQNAM